MLQMIFAERLEALVGMELTTAHGRSVRPSRLLGNSFRFAAYASEYEKREMALVVINLSSDSDFRMLSSKLDEFVRMGPPSQDVQWPTDYVADSSVDILATEGIVGYVIDVFPDGYHEPVEFLSHHARFISFRQEVDALLGIVRTFDSLHSNGFAFWEVNTRDFLLNPETGQTLLTFSPFAGCNAAITHDTYSFLPSPRFTAPELWSDNSTPNPLSDRHSMAVLLFMILLRGHPLEGRQLDYSSAAPMKCYGKDALFVFDPDDHSNEPDKRWHRYMLTLWPYLPGHLRTMFERCFSREAIRNPERRPSEAQWMAELVRLRSEVVRCRCGAELFLEDGAPVDCAICGELIQAPSLLDLDTYRLPGVQGTRLYRCQTCVCGTNDALDPVGIVVAHKRDARVLGILNVGDSTWEATTSKGQSRTVPRGGIVPLKDGVSFRANQRDIRIIAQGQSASPRTDEPSAQRPSA